MLDKGFIIPICTLASMLHVFPLSIGGAEERTMPWWSEMVSFDATFYTNPYIDRCKLVTTDFNAFRTE